MKILTLANSPLDPHSGSGYVICGYAERLRAAGHTVDLLGPADYEPLYGARRAIRHRQALGMARECLARLPASDYDVVEIYGVEGWLAMSLLRAMSGRRVLTVAHSNGVEPHAEEVLAAAGMGADFKIPIVDRLGSRAFRQADAIVTVSEWDAEWALERGYLPRSHVLAIDNPLAAGYLDLELGVDRERTILFCGNWIPRKGIDAIRRELPRVLYAHADWRLALVGVGTGLRVEEHFPAEVRSQIEVFSALDRETELKALYARASIVVVPSIYESFGLVTAEAMACGAAVAATEVGFAAGLVPDREFVSIDRSGGLGAAVLRLIGDRNLRDRVAQGGHARVQTLRWENAAARLESAYEGWLAELRRPSLG